MPEDVVALADRLWAGDIEPAMHHLFAMPPSLAEVADGVGFVAAFANVSAFDTGDGLVLVDTGSVFAARPIHTALREWTSGRLHTAVYSHGHIDHVFGVPVFEEEAAANGWPRPTVIAHDALPARFDRYILTAGYNGIINQRQFQAPGLTWPTEYRYPDHTYHDHHSLQVGDHRFELHHAKGETDDHTWTWVPDQRILCCGDLFIWASPNAGNPQKVQRFPREWAAALREMVALEPEILLPGHGVPVIGADRVRQALADTADLLDSLVDQTLALMNQGARLNDIIHSVTPPPGLMARPYLRPIYDEPEFVVRNVWRLYGGWYDGNPANLKPAHDAALAHEIAALAGGAARLAARAADIASAGDDASLRLAGHLAELAAQAAPGEPAVHAIRAEVFKARVAASTSTMAKGVFAWAAAESAERAQ
ncbi:MAG: alkyl sulfatase dimerization domain-containing protein [Acidimicrobiales bacterium]